MICAQGNRTDREIVDFRIEEIIDHSIGFRLLSKFHQFSRSERYIGATSRVGTRKVSHTARLR